ncbi:MAG: hypothetical protein PVI59_05685 [Anaerolineae bacterium]|jgi:hypothetical protein
MQEDSFADIPDWLKELEPPSSRDMEAESYEPEYPEFAEEEMGAAFEEPEEEGSTLVDDLREQAIADEELQKPDQPSGGVAAVFLGLTPMQRFILALLLFLDVALLGCMCLVMTGRIAPF